MRALVFTGPHNIKLREVSEPVVQSDHVLVDVRAAGICGSEMEAYLGLSDKRVGPLILGHELAGVIRSGGREVPVAINPIVGCGHCSTCSEGLSQLCASRKLLSLDLDGGHAEQLAVHKSQIVPIPSSMRFEDAAVAEPAATAINALSEIGDVAGASVLVIGCGAIGLFATQYASILGAGRICCADPIATRFELARSFGAERATADEKFAIVIDTVGSSATRSIAMTTVRPNGNIRVVGLREQTGVFNFGDLTVRQIHVSGIYAYTQAQFERALSHLADGTFEALSFTEVFDLDRGAEIFARLADRPDLIVKAVLCP